MKNYLIFYLLFDAQSFDKQIKSKMITINPVNELNGQAGSAMQETTRRRRTPSKYAESIKQFARINSKNSRRDKHSESMEDQSPPNASGKLDSKNTIACILPTSGKKLRLSIIIKKNPKPKMKKQTSTISLQRQRQRQKQRQKQKQRMRQPPKNISLLDTLLQVVQQYKADQENKKDENYQKNKQLVAADYSYQYEKTKKQNKSKKEKEQEEKYLRFYDKFRVLQEKLQAIESQVFVI